MGVEMFCTILFGVNGYFQYIFPVDGSRPAIFAPVQQTSTRFSACSIIMGADYYEKSRDIKENKKNNLNDICIGENTIIKNSIVDKNSRIGKNCRIINKDNKESFDGDNYYIRNSIIIIPKNSVINDNTEI